MDKPMSAPEPTAPKGPAPGDAETKTGKIDPSDQPVMALRGAGVEVNARHVGRVVVALCLVALAVLTVILFQAGVDKNAQITSLRQHGVAVEVTVSGCLGMMGGSGSNLVGYECRGTFTIDGHRYNDAIPGTALHAPRSTIRGITVPGDPALLSTPDAVATQHSSWKVFILPTILLVVLVLLIIAIVLRRRHIRRTP
jgi:hypothetical protein